MSNAHLMIVVGLSVAFTAGAVLPADAITRLRADQSACAQIQATVQREGVVVLQYPSQRSANLLLFDRYVASRAQCRLGEELKRDTVPAADTASCRVLRCQNREPRFNFERD